MYKSVFLDANIFIDANDDSRATYEQSFKIVPYLLSQNIKMYTSCDLITTIYYILAKKDKFQALGSIEQLSKFCRVIEFSNKEIDATCTLMRENGQYSDFEGALQYVLAKKQNCELIISNDKYFYSQDLPLLSSQDFCANYLQGV
jgi:predicted nucleic acid-binding protein